MREVWVEGATAARSHSAGAQAVAGGVPVQSADGTACSPRARTVRLHRGPCPHRCRRTRRHRGFTGPRPARPRPARHGRPGRLPQPARPLRRTDHHDHRAGRGGRPHRRPGTGRRRLPRQALRRPGAGSPHQSGHPAHQGRAVPPRAGPPGGTRGSRAAGARLPRAQPPHPPGPPGRNGDRAHAARVRPARSGPLGPQPVPDRFPWFSADSAWRVVRDGEYARRSAA